MSGVITEIQRGSIHDGPGIRTVVFVKGCNLRCFWCHNPEAIEPQRQLSLDTTKCLGCGACSKVCATGARNPAGIDRNLCVRCFACVDSCWSGALSISGIELTSEEVFAQIMEDRDFYQSSGGGVTISGGEPTLQAGFVEAILKRCHKVGIHTAIESNLCCPQMVLESLLPVTDLFMADLKCMDAAKHCDATGQPNDRILNNLRFLSGSGKPLIIRTPIISGFNDSADEISAIVNFVKSLSNVEYYELLGYHPLGCGKAKMLGMGRYANALAPVSSMKIRKIINAVKSLDIPIYINGRKFTS